MQRVTAQLGLVLVVLAASAFGKEGAETVQRVGNKVANFTLPDCYGNDQQLDALAKDKPVVLAFLGTECPLVKLYAGRLSEMSTEYKDQVAFIGINANAQDSLKELVAFTNRFELKFPLLKDKGNTLADQLSAVRTPEVFLVSKDRVVRYWGRIDDQYGIGYIKDKPDVSDLKNAIDQLLAGEDVKNPSVASIGCHIGREVKVEPTGDVTYSNQIAPIFNKSCVECHRDGQVAPFSLSEYDDTIGWGETIAEVISEKRMPPWFADPKHGQFANDARLSEEEKDLIFTWIENGMPEGDRSQLPEPPTFTEGWRIPEPDQVVYMNEDKKPYDVQAEGTVRYQYFSVDPKWKEDKYITAAEAKPGNPSVVHHIIAYVWPPGSRRHQLDAMLVGYAPGAPPNILTDGRAMYVPAGSKLVFEMHYTPNGKEQTDLSLIGLKFADPKDITEIVRGRMALNNDIRIPANKSNHVERSQHRLGRDSMLLSMTPHMHLRGKAFKYTAKYPDGESEVLLDVPAYDFNWQLSYDLAEPKFLPKGTRILCNAVYDNSEANLSNPNPEKTVRWGDQSWQEMMIGFFDTIPAVGEDAPSKNPTGIWKWKQRLGVFRTIDNELDLKLEGNRLTGTYRGIDKRKHPVLNGTVSGDRISMEVPVMMNGNQMIAVFDGKIEDEQITGTVILDSGLGSSEEFPWKPKLVKQDQS